MFATADSKADLRVIDFGMGVKNDPNDKESLKHTTFAGTAFYNSPEMFAHKYTQKTDVFSVGVTLYVLIAGYPADKLQRAFNVLQSSAEGPKRNLKELPNMPQNMPDSYYAMLDDLLTWQPKDRKNAGELLNHPFVTFHKDLAKEDAEDARKRPSMFRRQSYMLIGTAERHNLMLDYQKFERSLTTLLATMLPRTDLQRLMELLKQRQDVLNESVEESGTERTTGSNSEEKVDTTAAGKLGTIPLNQVLTIVKEDIQNEEV